MALAYQIPGVYFEPRPRQPEVPLARTDIAGFIGFDPRVLPATTASFADATFYAFRVDVAGFQLVIDGVRARVPATTNFVLAAGPAPSPVAPGESIVYAIAAALQGQALVLVAAAGTAAATDFEWPPDDGVVDAAVVAQIAPGTPWIRLANVVVRRDVAAVWTTAVPLLNPTLCEDERDYLLAFGNPLDDGTLLGPTVRAYFANGGRRCWVATVRRPDLSDPIELGRARADMVGISGSSELEATGLERLLLLPDVTFVDVPDLYARRVDRTVTAVPLPPPDTEACFIPCRDIRAPGAVATLVRRDPAWTPVFDSAPIGNNPVFLTQKSLLARAIDERWRVLLLLSVPLCPDQGGGPYVTPTDLDAIAWVGQFDHLVKAEGFADTDEVSCAALYWPWLLCEELVDGPVVEMPPSGYAAGIVARRDLARGPQISPANETLKQVVATARPVDDDAHARVYGPRVDASGLAIPAVNVIRAFSGYGIQVWGARTLSTGEWLQFLSVRRTLTAIELQMKAALDTLAFEPNAPALWLHITNAALGVLTPIFESGALRGSRPEEAFYIRCDDTINPPDQIALGRALVEVGVAIAAPMEFIVFRVGRREGVVEVLE